MNVKTDFGQTRNKVMYTLDISYLMLRNNKYLRNFGGKETSDSSKPAEMSLFSEFKIFRV